MKCKLCLNEIPEDLAEEILEDSETLPEGFHYEVFCRECTTRYLRLSLKMAATAALN